MIKAIPLSSSSQVDTLIWPFNPSGQYSVKSGYKFLQECAENSHASVQESAFWKKVWGLEVPSKVKNFVWRACREALPTRKNLQRRKIVPDGLCDLCKAGEECSHALFFCSDVQVIWSSEWPGFRVCKEAPWKKFSAMLLKKIWMLHYSLSRVGLCGIEEINCSLRRVRAHWIRYYR